MPAVAGGEAPDLDELRVKVAEVEDNAERYGQDDREAAAEFRRIRLTTLDPRRRARDMLEDLLSEIRGCWLLYQEYAEIPGDLSDEDDESQTSDEDLDDAIDAGILRRGTHPCGGGPVPPGPRSIAGTGQRTRYATGVAQPLPSRVGEGGLGVSSRLAGVDTDDFRE